MTANISQQRGDTLIEVLIAITVMGVIVAGVMSVMNHALATIIDTSERTAVRTEINTQTELLHYIRAKDLTTWDSLKSSSLNNSDSNIKKASDECTVTSKSFYLSATDDLSRVVKKQTPAPTKNETSRATAVNGKGIWIDAIYTNKSSTNAVPYFDFYIKACWNGVGIQEDAKSVTVVRIYDQE